MFPVLGRSKLHYLHYTQREHKTNHIDFSQIVHYCRTDNLYVFNLRTPNEGGLIGQGPSNISEIKLCYGIFPRNLLLKSLLRTFEALFRTFHFQNLVGGPGSSLTTGPVCIDGQFNISYQHNRSTEVVYVFHKKTQRDFPEKKVFFKLRQNL